MKRSSLRLILPECLMGAVLLALRAAERRTGFDSATGLALPTPLRWALLAAAAVFMAAELLRCRRAGGGTPTFERAFSRPEQELPVLLGGALLLAAGGALLAVGAVKPPLSVLELATGALAAAAGVGLILLVRQLRAGGETPLTAALPLLFFGVFLVLAIYLPFATDPILERYWLPVLAAAMTAFAFAQLTGFFREETKPRRFAAVAGAAVVLCIATLSDGISPALRLLLAAGAAVLAGFLMLLNREQE